MKFNCRIEDEDEHVTPDEIPDRDRHEQGHTYSNRPSTRYSLYRVIKEWWQNKG